MNSTTWIIEPNGLAWTLPGVATASLAAIAIRLWAQRQAIQQTQTPNHGSVVAWIALVLAVISVLCVLFRPSDPDNATMLITTLGVLVTCLVAWNIWQTIDTKQAVEDVVVLRTQFDALRQEIDILHGMHEAFVFDIFGEDNRRNGRSYLAFDYFMRSAFIFMRDMEHYDRRIMSAISAMRISFQDLRRPLMGVRDREINQFIERRENIISDLEELQRQARNLGTFAEQAVRELAELIDGIRNLQQRHNDFDEGEDDASTSNTHS